MFLIYNDMISITIKGGAGGSRGAVAPRSLKKKILEVGIL